MSRNAGSGPANEAINCDSSTSSRSMAARCSVITAPRLASWAVPGFMKHSSPVHDFVAEDGVGGFPSDQINRQGEGLIQFRPGATLIIGGHAFHGQVQVGSPVIRPPFGGGAEQPDACNAGPAGKQSNCRGGIALHLEGDLVHS